MRSIILLGSVRDPELNAVAKNFRADDFVFIDETWLRTGRSMQLSLVDRDSNILQLDGQTVLLSEITGILCRPALGRQADGSIAESYFQENTRIAEDYRRFDRDEAEALLLGALFPAKTRWVNHPAAEMVANHKVHQLAEAQAVGLTIPRTFVSTDPVALKEFWCDNSGMVINKAVNSISTRSIRETLMTRRVSEAELDVLAESALSPTLFQELVPAELDLRVTLVGNSAFCCAIYSQEGESPLDWRLDQTVKMTSYRMDDNLLIMLQQLKERLGLAYGAVDLRITPDGTPVFLEINPRGVFSFAEYYTGDPITCAIAAFLSGEAV
jgi:glutathione synthase/RimK-type ligase-like ATP-grasp enzyme